MYSETPLYYTWR